MEANIQSLNDIKTLANYLDIYKYFIGKSNVVFNKDAKIPDLMISALL